MDPLRRSPDLLRDIGDQLPNGAIYRLIHTPDGRRFFDYVSAGFDRLFDIPPGSACRDAGVVYSQVHPEDLEPAIKAEAAAVRAHTSYQFECRFILPGSRLRWFCWNSLPQSTPHGGVIFNGVVLDVTAQRETENRLRESQERYRALVEHSPAAITLTDRQGRFLAINRRFTELFGFGSLEELTEAGICSFDLVDPESRGMMQAGVKQLRELGTVTNAVLRVRRKDGSVFPAEFNLIHRHDSGYGQVVIQAIIQDVSDREKAAAEHRLLEQQLQQSRKLESLGLLAGGVAHDFNNLLSMILGNAELGLREVSEGSPVQQRLSEISRVVHRAADLCGQMLAFAGRSSRSFIPFNLSAMVREMTRMLEVAIPKKTTLKLNLADRLPLVEGDPTQIQQVVMNLILNSNEAIGAAGGTISVTTGAENPSRKDHERFRWFGHPPSGRRIFLDISDTGCGIDATTLPSIFDPFFSTKVPGRGLGLATVLGIIHRHQGTIGVATSPGQGSIFRVLLPAPPGLKRPSCSK